MKSLGLIGFGNFGQFITPYLKPYFDITIYNKTNREREAEQLGVKTGTLQDVAQKDVVILCVPVQFLEEVLVEIKDLVKKNAVVADVSSVKVRPVEMMKKHLPNTVTIIPTHPLFGPQSGKDGIQGLNFVLCPVNPKIDQILYRFFASEIGLNVLKRTPEVHDQQMAYVQALTHFIGRAVNEMDIPDVEQKTPAYQYLLNIKKNLGRDSMDLFLTIEQENPFAKYVRDKFVDELQKLNERLEQF
ncbi:MAG: prephenate dehydrogenase/arogenate dehydrogenase family protein [Cytophagales bacterium]|nr:prephenate dehydrogenase/arogenate dehydrogenase family protein [Cytophagales bacterium]